MANCSIPNSTPATGRTSTTSSRRSRSSNSTTPLGEAISLTAATELWIREVFNAQRSTLNAQRSIQTVGRWTLDACSRFIGVGRWTFFSFRRVKGAWWPSRSSKPSSPRKRRGRFDSYPLRQITFDGRCLTFDFSFALAFHIKHQASPIKHEMAERIGIEPISAVADRRRF